MTRRRTVHTASASEQLPEPREHSAPPLTVTPGARLRRALEAALAELRQIPPDDGGVMRRVNEDLHGALAHTAAVGETCLVAPAVEAVHVAEHCLVTHQLPQARAALTEALDRLAAPVVRPRAGS